MPLLRYMTCTLTMMTILLSGCASKPYFDMETASHQDSWDDLVNRHGRPFDSLEFLLDQQACKAATWEQQRGLPTITTLHCDSQPMAMAPDASQNFAIRSQFEHCLQFPLEPGHDAWQCLQEWALDLAASHPGPDYKSPALAPNSALHGPGPAGTALEAGFYGAIGTALLGPVFPALIGASVLAGVTDEAGQDGARRRLNQVQLGVSFETLEASVLSGRRFEVSESGMQATVIVGGGLSGNPVLAFGLADHRVVWVHRQPLWRCPGLGLRGCRIGLP
ncbi:MAG: hypothetical protein LAT56_17325 [Wenzhouxiangella sp.]|nr:hypothetical protein [Wenzhouxiangella sp.]